MRGADQEDTSEVHLVPSHELTSMSERAEAGASARRLVPTQQSTDSLLSSDSPVRAPPSPRQRARRAKNRSLSSRPGGVTPRMSSGRETVATMRSHPPSLGPMTSRSGEVRTKSGSGPPDARFPAVCEDLARTQGLRAQRKPIVSTRDVGGVSWSRSPSLEGIMSDTEFRGIHGAALERQERLPQRHEPSHDKAAPALAHERERAGNRLDHRHLAAHKTSNRHSRARQSALRVAPRRIGARRKRKRAT